MNVLLHAMLELPPSINDYWGERVVYSRDQRRYMALRYVTHEGKEYQRLIADRIQFEFRARHLSRERIGVYLLVCPRSPNRQDIDNRVKVMLDVLKSEVGGVYADDSQIDVLQVERGPIVQEGRVVVRVWEIPAQAARHALGARLAAVMPAG